MWLKVKMEYIVYSANSTHIQIILDYHISISRQCQIMNIDKWQHRAAARPLLQRSAFFMAFFLVRHIWNIDIGHFQYTYKYRHRD